MLNSRATKTAVVLVAGALIASTLVAASPAPLSATTGATGDLDTTFDTDGWNTISGTGLWFEAASVVVQSSGKVVVAGARMNGSQFDPLIARFNTDGSLDTTFGSDGTGIVVEPWPNATIMEWVNRSGAAVDVALLSDDRIVVTSSPSGDNEKHGIMLFTSDGVLDTSFDGDGRRKIASGGPNMDVWTTAVTVTSDDKIMIVGTSPDNGWDYRMKVYRLNTDGSNDTSFNNDGMRNVYFPSSVDNLANAVVMSGDKTVFGGSAADSWSRHDMGIGQLTSDGRNDTAFASGTGRTYVDFGFGDSDVRELLIQADGKIVAIGESQVFDNDDSVAVTRLNADGSLDTSFSGDGKFAYDFGNGDSYGWAGAIDEDGRIVIAGQYNNGANDKAFVMRLTTAGELDTSFGTGGIKTFDFVADHDEKFNAIAVQGDDMVVAGGSGSNLLVARLGGLYSLGEVTFNANGGTGAPSAVECWSGSVTLPSTAPTRSGYSFAGWSTAVNGSDTASIAVTGITMEGPSQNQSGTIAASYEASGWISLNEHLSAGQRLVMDKDFFDDLFQEFPYVSEIKIGIKDPTTWSNTAHPYSDAFVNDHFIRIIKYQTGNTIARHYTQSSYTGLDDVVLTWVDYEAFFELSSDGDNIRYGQRDSGTYQNPTATHDIRITQYPDWDTDNKVETGDQGYGYTAVDVVMQMTSNWNGQSWDTANIDWTGLELAASPGASVSCADVTLYAQWTQNTSTIAYDANGGSGDPPDQTCTSGNVTLSSTAPTRSGYAFAGWNTAANGSGTNHATGASVSCANLTLYAQWAANALGVTYNSQGGSNVTDGDATTTTGGAIAALPTDPTRDGYSFTGWFTAASGGSEITAGAAHGQDADFTLYAQWTANTLGVTYNSQGGSNVTDGDATTTTGGAIAALPTDPTRTGYTFNGWYTAASGGTELTAGAAHNQTSDFTLYAQWQINTVTLAYDPQGGTGQPDAHAGDAGSAVTVSSIVPTRAGYTFAGWNTQIDGSGSPCIAGDEYTLPMEGSATLFAQWQVTPTTTTTTTTTVAPTTTTTTTTTTTVAPTTTTTVASPPGVVLAPPVASPPAAPTPGTPTFTG